MLALLKLIPIKDYFYGAVILALLALLAYVYRHGEIHIEKLDAKVATAAEKKSAVSEATADAQESSNAIIYKQAVSVPAVGDLGVECVRHSTSSGVVSAPVAGTAAAAGVATVNAGSGSAYDPSGAILTRARAADAQIAYLQARVRELEAEMNAAP